jgi:hypothetical protein
MKTINLSLRIINGFTLDENFDTVSIEDDRYNFTLLEGTETPTQDEVIGDKEAIVSTLRNILERLENSAYTEVKFENWFYDPEKGHIKLPY